MHIGVAREHHDGERRVAATPDSVARLLKIGVTVTVQTGAGEHARYSDDDYRAAGAQIAATPEELLAVSDILIRVQAPEIADVSHMKEGAVLVGMLKPDANPELLSALAARRITAFSLERVPRSTRAQGMDVLSSQANLAGYRAVIEAAAAFEGAFPMFMTAAGTVRAARVLVIGAGVAGLQAIATAKRLGAVVSAFDIRPAARDEVKSLGAKFVELDLGIANGEQKGGYARELTDDERRRQSELLADVAAQSDIVITTAAVPGRPAPKILNAATVSRMKPGSVVFDLAAESGGNCELTRPGQTHVENRVSVIGALNVPARMATEASNLYARNMLNFLANLIGKNGEAAMRPDDDILAATCVTNGGEAPV